MYPLVILLIQIHTYNAMAQARSIVVDRRAQFFQDNQLGQLTDILGEHNCTYLTINGCYRIRFPDLCVYDYYPKGDRFYCHNTKTWGDKAHRWIRHRLRTLQMEYC